MTTSYSNTPLATNSLDYKPNLIEVNNQQTSEVKQDTSFTQKLQDALSPKSDTQQNTEALATSANSTDNAEGTVDVGIMDVAPAAMNIGMGLASGNPVAAGLAGTDLLQSVLRADIEKQFTELGQGIAAALIAGMSGDPSATQVLPTAEELAEQEKQIEQTKRDVRDQTINALLELNNAFAGDTEEQQKKAFERSKKIQSAQALISTYESAVQAFKSLAGIPVVGPALGTAASVAAIASGLAQVKNIKSQTFGGGGGTAAAPAPAPSLSAAATEATQAPSAPTLDLSFLGDIATTPQPQQAYVISENVTTAQQANKKIQDQAAL